MLKKLQSFLYTYTNGVYLSNVNLQYSKYKASLEASPQAITCSPLKYNLCVCVCACAVHVCAHLCDFAVSMAYGKISFPGTL